ncbi:transposase [Stutzerimonas stutzeri]|uniref:transposase n=1 Tax=Stutzerimonas stutzeri TaxID=316 RepID=UPI00210D7BB8|nr:transposase [Stutzerimonas stutzeri]MCQ4319232.1 transposase [Stutzerimonas stutzeri]
MNTDAFIGFLKALMKDAETPVFLILDNHPVHHARRVREYVESLSGRLKLFFLPPYSPELNPDEPAGWGYIKYHHVYRTLYRYLVTQTKVILDLVDRVASISAPSAPRPLAFTNAFGCRAKAATRPPSMRARQNRAVGGRPAVSDL